MLLSGFFYLIARQGWVQVAAFVGMVIITLLCTFMGELGALLWLMVMPGNGGYHAVDPLRRSEARAALGNG
jgi:hypothetical protein